MAIAFDCKCADPGPARRFRVRPATGLRLAGAAVLGLATVGPALAEQAVTCGGAAMAGGAELICNHVLPTAPPQFCTYSWALMTTSGSTSIAQGSFLITPGMSDDTVYQGWGFSSALSNPIVLCQGRHR